MTTSRRRFLTLAAATGGAVLLNRPGLARSEGTPPAPGPGAKLSILVLGGTKFLGPAIVEPALAAGHKVTLFNRGKTNPQLFPEAEKLRGDRDPKKGDGIKALSGRKFDVIYDDSGYYPRMVRASAQALAAAGSGQYVFVSSISAYRDNKAAGADETAAVATMPDPTLESMGANFEYYGALKALCEKEAREAFGERTTIVRPGYIVGPNDPTDRFTWYPVRAAKGGEMLAPGAPTDPLQIIDVRDLGAWMLRLGERRVFGTFNACGPKDPLTMGTMLELCLAATGRKATLVWVPGAFLRARGENGEGKIPIWAPADGDTQGYHTWSNARAVKAGLTFRPLPETIADTLAWFRTLPAERQADLKCGFSEKDEAELIAAWRASKG
ncbi:MAG: NAD-dependent epimerase/dehydratase family protein [Acidobacteria bacterium]|nr:NAD-dependent epimerase/dehydratase family protein [Acidobacteriota bacterium]